MRRRMLALSLAPVLAAAALLACGEDSQGIGASQCTPGDQELPVYHFIPVLVADAQGKPVLDAQGNASIVLDATGRPVWRRVDINGAPLTADQVTLVTAAENGQPDQGRCASPAGAATTLGGIPGKPPATGGSSGTGGATAGTGGAQAAGGSTATGGAAAGG